MISSLGEPKDVRSLAAAYDLPMATRLRNRIVMPIASDGCRNPGAELVRGWAVSAHCGETLLLDAHSIVREPDGTLLDITLGPDDQAISFIVHRGDEAKFQAALRRFNQIWWPQRRPDADDERSYSGSWRP